MTATIALFRFTIRQALLDIKFWLVVAALFFPCLLAATIRYFGPPMDVQEAWKLYHGLVQFMFLMGLIPLACMVYGSGLIGSEVESRTITYLITRTLKRRTILLVRFAALFIVLTAACVVALGALNACMIAGQEWSNSIFAADGPWDPVHDLKVYLLLSPAAVAGFLAVFTFIGLLAARPLALSLIYFVIFELVVANVPAAVSKYSLLHQLRGWAVSAIPPLNNLNPELLLPDEGGLRNVALVVLAALLISSILITRKELVPHKVAKD